MKHVVVSCWNLNKACCSVVSCWPLNEACCSVAVWCGLSMKHVVVSCWPLSGACCSVAVWCGLSVEHVLVSCRADLSVKHVVVSCWPLNEACCSVAVWFRPLVVPRTERRVRWNSGSDCTPPRQTAAPGPATTAAAKRTHSYIDTVFAKTVYT